MLDYVPLWARKRKEIGIPLDATLLISVGELNENKNNQVIIEALGKIKDKSIHYILCGIGDKEKELRQRVHDLDLSTNVHFLGYRSDTKELLNASDIFIMSSFREGLSRSIMEAMASGLPCIASRIRGNVDLLENGKGGYLVCPNDEYGFSKKIYFLANSPEMRVKMEKVNQERIKKFDLKEIKNQIKEIYKY